VLWTFFDIFLGFGINFGQLVAYGIYYILIILLRAKIAVWVALYSPGINNSLWSFYFGVIGRFIIRCGFAFGELLPGVFSPFQSADLL
jgi:hypothetical protein